MSETHPPAVARRHLIGEHLGSFAVPLLPSFTPLRHRPVLAIWLAQLLSVTGDRFFALAVMWLALQRSGPMTMGLVAIAESVPYIAIGAVGHPIVSRFVSFRRLAGVDAVRAGLTVLLPFAWMEAGTPAMLAVVAALGVLGAVFDPALSALVPELVDEPQRPVLVALMDLTARLARIGGPALVGVLLAVAPMTALFVADAATFAVSTVALALLGRTVLVVRAQTTSGPPEPAPSRPRARLLLRENPALSVAFVVQGAGFFLNALPGIGLPVLLAHQLGAGPALYGAVMTATGIAALAGNLVTSRLPSGRFPTRFCAAWTAVGILQMATGAAGSVAGVVVCATLTGLANPVVGISMGTHLAGFAPAARLRLLAINHLVMRGAGTVGMAVIPSLLGTHPARGFVLGGAALTLVAGTGAVLAPASTRRMWVRVAERPGTNVSTTTRS